MTTTLIIDKEPEQLTVKPVSLIAIIEAFEIKTNEDRSDAETLLEKITSAHDKRFNYLDPPRAKAYADYKYHKKRLDDALDGIEDTKKVLKQKCITWDQEQECIRQEEQRRAEAASKKRAEDEALALAAQAEAEGDTETAEAIIAEPVQVAPVLVPRTAPAASRLSAGRTVWFASVVDLKKLCLAIGQGTASTEFVMGLDKSKDGIIGSPALNKLASAMRTTMNVQGVVAKSKTV